MANCARTGAWSDRRSRVEPGPATSRCVDASARGARSTAAPRASRWSIAVGAVGAARPKRRSSPSNAAPCRDGRRLRSPPKSSGPPAAKSDASRAACSASPAPRPVSGTDRCMQATVSGSPPSSSTRASNKARRSGTRVSSWRCTATIRAGPRTSTMFDPPSFEAIRSGLSHASADRIGASPLRDVSPSAPWARQAVARAASQRGGASCSSATSHSQPARQAANGARSGRLTCAWVALRSVTRSSRERLVRRAGSGGKSRPWKRFQVRARNRIGR